MSWADIFPTQSDAVWLFGYSAMFAGFYVFSNKVTILFCFSVKDPNIHMDVMQAARAIVPGQSHERHANPSS
jgi:hypothetical protein